MLRVNLRFSVALTCRLAVWPSGRLHPDRTLQIAEVASGIPEAIRVVDSQPGHRAPGDQPQQESVRRGEDLGDFLAHGGQLIDGEEATVVDLLARRAERGEAVRLRIQ